jgi:hypothetical protein
VVVTPTTTVQPPPPPAQPNVRQNTVVPAHAATLNAPPAKPATDDTDKARLVDEARRLKVKGHGLCHRWNTDTLRKAIAAARAEQDKPAGVQLVVKGTDRLAQLADVAAYLTAQFGFKPDDVATALSLLGK